MEIYLISTIFKKSRGGGTYVCNVYKMVDDQPIEVSENVSKAYWFRYENWSLDISFGSWTGFNRIKQALTDSMQKENVRVYDLSVYNQ